jgi:hypothetical protein
MDRLLARLERRFGRYALENFASYIIGGMVLVFVLASAKPGFLGLLTFTPHALGLGQPWRLVTYIFIPPWTRFDFSPFTLMWLFFTLSLAWTVLSSLEAEWGALKLNAYYVIGMLGTTMAGYLTGGEQTNQFLNMSVILAFATIFPEYEILLFFIIPVRMRWLGWIAFAYLAYAFAMEDWIARGAIIAAMSNYLLFFWGEITRVLRGGKRVTARQVARGASVPPPRPALEGRACAMCGAKEGDGADIRVCSCAKCKEATGGQARLLCLEHARAH